MKVGSKCVCLDGKFPLGIEKIYTSLPKEGETYVIRAMGVGQSVTTGEQGEIMLLLVGVNNPPRARTGLEPGFRIERFKGLDELK